MLNGARLIGSVLVLLGVAMMVGCSECQTCPKASNGEVSNTTVTIDGQSWQRDAGTETNKTIAQTLQDSKEFSIFVKALDSADMMGILKGTSLYTVFAPTDDAFKKLPAGVLDKLLSAECKSDLRELLNYHIITGKVSSCDFEKITASDSLLGEPFKVCRKNNVIWIDNAKVIQADISACNGYINKTDRVLIPCDLQKRIRQLMQSASGQQKQVDKGTAAITRGQLKSIADLAKDTAELSMFYDALVAADMLDTLSGTGTYTVFVPTNEAWNKLSESQLTDLFKPENKAKLQNVLKMHIVKGDAFTQNQIAGKNSIGTLGDRMLTVQTRDHTVAIDAGKANIVKPDVKASNGVIQEIDTVILP
jgi:uncharacterized surface protein with fasciclin (FAS1) repeats